MMKFIQNYSAGCTRALVGLKTVGRSAAFGEKAAEGSRTPRPVGISSALVNSRSVLECGCPLPLSLGGGRDRYFNSQPLAWRSLRFALLAIVILCLAQARPSLAATTATTNKTSTLD